MDLLLLSIWGCVGFGLRCGGRLGSDRKTVDYCLLFAERDAFLEPLRCSDSPNADLLFQHQVPLNSYNLLDNWNDDDVLFLPDRWNRVDRRVQSSSFDLDLFMVKQLVDQLLMAMGDPRDLHPARRNDALGDGHRLFEERNLHLAIFLEKRVRNRIQTDGRNVSHG